MYYGLLRGSQADKAGVGAFSLDLQGTEDKVVSEFL